MQKQQIIFGTKKLGKVAEKAPKEKYPNHAVVTVEGVKEAKKSRRILFNTKASELLGLEPGETQWLVFGSVERGVGLPNEVLVMNTSEIGETDQDMTSYRASKNPVSIEDTKEKFKSVSSTHMCNEIFSFLEKDDSVNTEFSLTVFPSEEVNAFSLSDLDVESQDLTEEEELTGQHVELTSFEETPMGSSLSENGLTSQKSSSESDVAESEANEEVATGIPSRNSNAVVEEWS